MRSLKLKKILASMMVILVTTASIGCTENKVSKEDNSEVISGTLNSDNLNKEDSVSDSENKEENNEVVDSSEDIKEMVELTLYSKDVNTEEQVILKKIEVDKNSSVEDNLKTLANELSQNAFDNLPINLVEIKEIDGKKIAHFNLDELEVNSGEKTPNEYEGINWVNNYFAGSAGGSITEYTLITTLLQKEYTGEWIDGLEFTYKGAKIEFDHIPELSETIYR